MGMPTATVQMRGPDGISRIGVGVGTGEWAAQLLCFVIGVGGRGARVICCMVEVSGGRGVRRSGRGWASCSVASHSVLECSLSSLEEGSSLEVLVALLPRRAARRR